MQNTFFLPFPFPFLGRGGFEKNNKTPYHEMHECYAMKILKIKIKNKTTKKNSHKELRDEAQGPCQKDSIRLSLLYPKPIRCNSSIGVIILIRMMSNSKIGIKI